MRDTPGRPGARDLSDDALQQVLEVEVPMRAIRGDDMPSGPLVEREQDQAMTICLELERIANALLEIHLALHEVQKRIKENA